MSTNRVVRKAVIPAAGLGTRFLPATKAQPKEMLPVVDRPSIQYVVEEAVAAGIDDILIITGRNKRSLEDHFDRNFELEYHLAEKGKTDDLADVIELADLADIHYVRQGEPLGLGHAVSVARKHVGNNPFVVLLGDDIMHQRSHLLKDMIATYEETGASTVALMEVEPSAISAYGCAAPEDRQGPLCNIVDVVEKPKAEDAPSNLAIVGRYLFTPAIFDAIEQVQPGVGGEIQLTDAIGLLLKDEPVKGQIFEEGRFDIGNKIEYLRATVELALERDDLGPEFRHVLSEIIKRHGIV
ncbi:MAG TPA: UTP--glucose-1-phosphate uridylyltransferase GalU [Microthrixaceae bacterium]|jgi:UTP--glucose-1-phosphate uridylyltransferase|nr:UTP--glucose-1-phosphate uridylyltransferase GalU [Microthrixaceae bacterium]